MVYFYINGTKTPVIVDDHFPCYDWSKPKCAFASSNEGELWVSLLEKAWAKLHGSYARTESGQPKFAFSQLVGLPGNHFNHNEKRDDLEKFWKLLKIADQQNYFMIAITPGKGENKNTSGIISGHAYSVISVFETYH